MKKKLIYPVAILLVALLLPECTGRHTPGVTLSFNEGWRFIRQDSSASEYFNPADVPDDMWEEVSLPHTAMIEPPSSDGIQWTGVSWYRKTFRPDRAMRGHHISLLFEGAMNDAIIYLNGTEIYHNTGGYLPFFVDLTNDIRHGHDNEILVKLDNRSNSDIPPGPLGDLGFLYYGGLYRNVKLIVKDKLHITNAIEIDSVQGGGVMTGFINVTTASAIVTTSTLIQNSDRTLRSFSFRTSVLDAAGTVVTQAQRTGIELMPGRQIRIPLDMNVNNPALWSPEHPFLYTLRTEIIEGETVTDRCDTRIGIRDLKIDPGAGVLINGERTRVRGTNRLQEYPYLGYALSDNAHFRDAYKIKEAGFNFVRCPHYPASTAFLDACDELGIMVMEAIPGDTFMGDSTFRQEALANTRILCRRDRNHPSVILWETSVDKADMPYRFLAGLNRTAHAEISSGIIYTCSRMDTICDVVTSSAGKIKASDWLNSRNRNKPLIISDYTYYDSPDGNGKPAFTENGNNRGGQNGRQQLNDREQKMLQQAEGFMRIHNYNLAGPAIGDASWLMFSYNRGQAADRETTGIMDQYRIPGYSYWFYRSQAETSPVCFIAYNNMPGSGRTITVFSNADSVVLSRNDTVIAKQGPDINENTINLAHPPFTFRVNRYSRGVIKAKGIKDGSEYSSFTVATPSKPAAIRLNADMSNRSLAADGADALFVYASVVDSTDNHVMTASDTITFSIRGEGVIVGNNTVVCRSGVAPVIIRSTTNPGKITLKAKGRGLSQAEIMIESK